MKKYGLFTFSLIATITAIICTGCVHKKPFEPNGYENKVVRVIDGRTLELGNGLRVRLIGVKESELSKKYLEEHVKGKTVVLIRDVGSNTPLKKYKGLPKEVKAYAKVKGDLVSVNGNLLMMEYSKFDAALCRDSFDVFTQYARQVGPDKIYTSEELLTKIKPATFQIRHDSVVGTGFFINETGLAVTNNHVLSTAAGAVCIFFGENGELDEGNYRNVDRILLTFRNNEIDFTVFQVRLDPDEKVSYIPLARKRQNDGVKVWKLGCPVGLTANFQEGILSNYIALPDNDGNEYYYLAHSCGTNNGDSGGPVVNDRAEAAGINQSILYNRYLSELTGSAQKAEGIAYAVDAVTIRQLMKKYNIEYHK